MVVIYLRANCSIRRISRIIILPVNIHEAALRISLQAPCTAKPITYFEVSGTAFHLVTLSDKNMAQFEIASVLRSREICRSIGIAWMTAFCTSGMVIADAAWPIVNAKLELEDGWKAVYP